MGKGKSGFGILSGVLLLVAALAACPQWASGSPKKSGVKRKAHAVGHSEEALPRAVSVLLYDPQEGRILFGRNVDVPLPPASTTKLMTALLVYEKTGLRGWVRVQPEDTRVEPSHIPLVPGETVSVRDLVWALLIGSENDAALALARYTSGSVSAFVAEMNRKAAELGCTHTHFANPHGLPAAGQLTTARDLLRIFEAVLAVPELRNICATPYFHLTTASGDHWIKNHNKLLGKYPGMGPAKTGWTRASLHTFAACCQRDGRELHLILLASPNKWKDARWLFDMGFATVHLSPKEDRLGATPTRRL
jgi:D-alanyl-D-alanine carboxypeptidase (penicillin-binding protein 5/6)